MKHLTIVPTSGGRNAYRSVALRGCRMSMLDRYYKPGGFIQLLNLLETCTPAKQAKFLEIIREEDNRWAATIEKKMLNIHRILTWSEEALAEVTGNLQELTIAIALHGLDEQQRDSLCRSLTTTQKRRVRDLFESSRPSSGEITTMLNKVIVEVRRMITDGALRMEKVDPELVIDDDIEDLLRKGLLGVAEAASNVIALETPLNFDAAAALTPAEGPNNEEINLLRKKLTALTNENSQLKGEISKLRLKVDQIKKLVA